MVAATLERFAQPVGSNKDLLLVVALIGILLAILLPIPGFLIDGFLALNITFSLLILMTAVYIRSPLDFSVFPSLLLVMTLYRLALNIATTRLILSDATEHGKDAAGSVIKVFGGVVTAGNPVVGLIIFAVIVIIQFVVITKGATRIAEVAARFTLDKMPGQQLSIDADLNAGLIDEGEAKRRRERISEEADFYGAMDGASKFVRGDAVAGILITLINIVGGLVIGMAGGLGFLEAVEVFTSLTIGDGLVSQVPALLVSVAAALVVTRQSGESNLGTDLIGQVFSSSRAVAVTAVFLLLLISLGMPPHVMIGGALLLGAIAYTMRGAGIRQAEEEEAQAAEAREAEESERGPKNIEIAGIDPLELEVGYGLVNLVDPSDGAGLLQRIGLIREQIANELGLVVPPVRIRDNMQFKSDEYAIKLRGEVIARNSVMIDHYLAMDSGLGLEKIDGIPTTEPAFGIEALWIAEENKGRAEAIGYTVVDVISVLATHLTELIRKHAYELLTREETGRLVDKLKESAPALVEEVVPAVLKVGDVQKVLQLLLKENVPIRDLEAILETLGDWAPRTKDVEVLTEYVRNTLSRSITRPYLGSDDRLHVVTIDPRIEEYVSNAVEHNERGSTLKLSPDNLGQVVRSVVSVLEKLLRKGFPPIVVTAPQIRLHLRKALETQVPGLICLSYNEVSGLQVESHGLARIEDVKP